MSPKRVNKWALVALIVAILFSIVGGYLLHLPNSSIFQEYHWAVTLVIAIPWVIFILCLFIMLFADKTT